LYLTKAIILKDILLITPPFTQLNTPYPATAYLKGFLNTKNISSYQMDLGIEVILELFTEDNLKNIFSYCAQNRTINSENSQRIYALRNEYIETVNEVILFLQDKNQTLARKICSNTFLPQASRFDQLDDLEWAFGNMGMQDKAKHLCTLYIEDLSDFISECVDENFGFSRYAEKLGRSANSFDELYSYITNNSTYINSIMLSILEEKIQTHKPKLVCFSVPFPGNLYSAFKCAEYIKLHYPNIKIAMGGGFPTTELRSLKDIRVFEFFDYIALDDGELPIELIFKNVINSELNTELKRTFILENNLVVYKNNSEDIDYKQSEIGCPDYSDLPLDLYISVIEILNPMHSLWSDGRWIKLTMAHGCYWGKCTFCDGSLDYIKRHEPIAAKILVDRIEQIIEKTGERGFHFVDEAAPPALMRSLALEIIRRKLSISWWTNIRFEKNFSVDTCKLLKASGCIAVSGGLEVASDRMLQLINKGTNVSQVAQVTRNLSDAGIMVHAYLMYGFPSQTVQETIDSLEMVRQMIDLDIIQSGFWHQFALTAHSPIGKAPQEYGINPIYNSIEFADNDIEFTDSTGIDHSKFSFGLKKSLFNFMHGIGFELPLQEWFDFKIPHTTIPQNYIENALCEPTVFKIKPQAKIVWLGTEPTIISTKKNKTKILFHVSTQSYELTFETNKAEWLLGKFELFNKHNATLITYAELKSDFELHFNDFELFWFSKPMKQLNSIGLVVL